MTEGAPAPLATWQDVQGRWRTLSTAEQELATTRIADASALLRTLVRDIDTRAGQDTNLGHVVASTVADVVIRFLQNPQGAKSLQETIGPRAYGLTFGDRPSGIFFTDGELAALRPSAGTSGAGQAIGSAMVGIRPGWGPIDVQRPWWL